MRESDGYEQQSIRCLLTAEKRRDLARTATGPLRRMLLCAARSSLRQARASWIRAQTLREYGR